MKLDGKGIVACVRVYVFLNRRKKKRKILYYTYVYIYNKSQQIINSVILRICAHKEI